MKLISNSFVLALVKLLQVCLLFVSLIWVGHCTNFTHEEGGLFRIVEEIGSHGYRRNITESLHYRFNRRLGLLTNEDEEPLARRLINTFRPPIFDSSSQNINQDPLWNSNNRYSNRFERFDKITSNIHNNINRRPLFTTYPTYSTFTDSTFTPATAATTNRPVRYYKPNYNKPVSSATRPTTGAAGAAYNHRPTNSRPTHSKPDRHPKYNAECACKRKIGTMPTSSVNEPTVHLPTNGSTLRTNMSNRSTSTRNLSANDRVMPRISGDKPFDPRIVNGTVANYYQVPWMVSMGKATDGKYTNESHFCGATLISPNWIISAGHCLTDFKPKKIIVAYGSGNRTDMKHFSEVDTIVVHPNYSGWPRYQNDIALVKLKEPVRLDGSIKPACLLHSNTVKLAKQLEAIGWGRTGPEDEFPVTLQKSRFEHVSLNDCKARWDKELDHPDVTRNSICVYNQYSDICGGDSGSALHGVGEDGVSYMVGVASFTNFCDQTQPAVYVQVLPYMDWIVQNVKNFC